MNAFSVTGVVLCALVTGGSATTRTANRSTVPQSWGHDEGPRWRGFSTRSRKRASRHGLRSQCASGVGARHYGRMARITCATDMTSEQACPLGAGSSWE